MTATARQLKVRLPQTYPVHNALDRQRAIQALQAIQQVPLVVTISKPKSRRSLAQNRLYWGLWLREIAAQTGYSVDEAHEFCKRKFLSRIYLAGAETPQQERWLEAWETVRDLSRGLPAEDATEARRRVIDLISTTWATVGQFSAYLTAIDQYFTAHGIPLPHPDDLCYTAMEEAA